MDIDEVAEETGDKVKEEVKEAVKEAAEEVAEINADETAPAVVEVVESGTIALAIQTGENTAEIAAVVEELETKSEEVSWLETRVKLLEEQATETHRLILEMKDSLTPPLPPELPPMEVATEMVDPSQSHGENTDSAPMEAPRESAAENPVAELGEAVTETLQKPLIKFL